MPIRNANAVWEGALKDGKGKMHAGSGKFDIEFTFGTRFGEDPGTNPEELIGAAYAGCFSMALSGILDKAGYKSRRIRKTAKVHLEKIGDGYRITAIDLDTQGEVPGIEASTFAKHAEEARDSCPVSQALTGIKKSVKSSLVK